MVFHDYKCKGVGKPQPDSVAHCASTDGVWGLLCVNVDTNVCTRVCMYMCVWWRAAVLLPQLTKQPSFRLKVNVKSYSNWICTRNSTNRHSHRAPQFRYIFQSKWYVHVVKRSAMNHLSQRLASPSPTLHYGKKTLRCDVHPPGRKDLWVVCGMVAAELVL